MKNKERYLKTHFLKAVNNGELGAIDDKGIIITLDEFKNYFNDVTSDYASSFLPAATLEPGQITMSHTKFMFRIRRGVYRVHEDALQTHDQNKEHINRI